MRIVIDTREQTPLAFQQGMQTERGTLPVGDYHCIYDDGSRPPIIFERKAIGDLYSTMTAGYIRFKAEMADADRRGVSLVLLVEGTLADVYAGAKHSAFPGTGMVQKLFTLWFRYGLQPVFCASRADMAAYIVETYEAIGRCWYVDKRPVAARPDAVFGSNVLDFRSGRPVELAANPLLPGTGSSTGYSSRRGGPVSLSGKAASRDVLPPANASLDDLLALHVQAGQRQDGWECDMALLADHVPGLVMRVKALETLQRQIAGQASEDKSGMPLDTQPEA